MASALLLLVDNWAIVALPLQEYAQTSHFSKEAQKA